MSRSRRFVACALTDYYYQDDDAPKYYEVVSVKSPPRLRCYNHHLTGRARARTVVIVVVVVVVGHDDGCCR